MKRLFASNHEPSRELVPIDDVIAALPFIVRRDHRIVIAAALALLPALAEAGTTCTTRKSGSVTITSCSSSGRAPSTTCRSYMSGSVRKTSCS